MATSTAIDTSDLFLPRGQQEPLARIRERDGEVQQPWA